MNLLQARATGKWYRRPCWGEGIYVRGNELQGKYRRESFYEHPNDDIDATDYEIEPDPAPVVRKVTVWRPIYKRTSDTYALFDRWSKSKDFFTKSDEIVGWESKVIEVSE